ncbi:periplasmic binding protein-like II [Karstenula rhodostoma CBS 690.94]|uniref:Periplasmic binding protein-like II n=1 Tax=Karstenula rhodostoma CBS 690.94 TaxID=1392251 RepID=A0A9P4P5R5_9PLEO|nr:periplasmic binding protein-like II [Karstenula rhodostoma CBS 690.94]
MATSTLRIALENVDFRLPTQVTDDNSVVALKSLTFEPLLRWQPGGLVKPGLFDRWEHSPDGKIWHFHIRDNAFFHDGKACTAHDVESFIKGFLNSRDYFDMPWSYARYLARATISAPDDQNVKIENPEPLADILDILCDFWPCRMSEDGKPVLGTGKYRVVEFDRHNNVGKATLHLVDKARSRAPEVIIAIHERDGERRLNALRAGEVDVALNLERADNLNVLNFDPSLAWGRVTSTLSAMFYLDSTKGVFSSPDARLAANFAVDNTALVKDVFQGLARPSATIVSPHHLGFKAAELNPIPYDVAAAKELLQGMDISAPIRLRTPQYMPEHAEKISKFVASSLEAVGFKVNIEVETNRPEYARSIGFRKNIGDLALFDSTPNSTFRVLDDKISSASRNTWWLGYHDDEVQELIKIAREKVENSDRAIAYGECLRRLQANPAWLYIAHPDVVWATRPGINLTIGPSGILTLE